MKNNSEYQFKYITFKELKKLSRNHTSFYKDLGRSLWTRLKNCPDINDNFPCFFYLINKNNEIVCSNKALPDILYANDKKYQWAWTGDIFTEIPYRKQGLATMLIREVTKILHQQDIGRGMVFSTDIALHILRKLNYSFVGYANRYVLVKCAKPFLEAHIRSKSITVFLDLLARPIISLHHRLFSGRRRFNTLEAETFEFQINENNKPNESLPKTYHPNKFHFNDILKKVIWKISITNSKGYNCRLYILKAISSADPLAYFVVRIRVQRNTIGDKYKNFSLMTLMNFCLFKDDKRIVYMLLKKVIDLFWESEAEVLEVISSSEIFLSAMRSMGMIKVGKGMSFTIAIPATWDIGKDSAELKNWSLTHFCGDGFTL